MVKITLDHSALIFHHRHPVIKELKELEKKGKIELYHADNLRRELEKLSTTEEKIYHKLREMVFGKPQADLTLIEHGDLCLLVNHLKSGRDYFVTLDANRYKNLKGHPKIKIRFADDVFLKEIQKDINRRNRIKKIRRGEKIKVKRIKR